ncbi:hypothetical protein [Streptomyces montanisoli]|uniref:Uncharacterized protein n=1 Tax=Streptomyces montanisoli TaxID=2798581 RepID=A0A940RTG7_9ACTN|nr:hypothetical protein [Streptomyces montanisoli]MBP0456847.1 hypothetical protein [Streptomyces montanisoli]
MHGTRTGLIAVRAAYGGVAVLAPRVLLRLYGGDESSQAERAVLRVLGGRHLLQAAVTLLSPRPAVWDCGAAVDAAHSASMLALARIRPELRATAGRDAVAAGLFAASSALAGRLGGRRRAA